MTQPERIAYYEGILDRAAAAAERLEAALDEFEAVQPLVRALDAYYGGADWRGDLADDEAGKLPQSLKRGVLSEDAAYDALTDNRRLLLRMQETAASALRARRGGSVELEEETAMKVIDLTHPIAAGMPVYPGTEPPLLEPANTYERDGFRETRVTMYTHTGTHMDPPAHIFPGRTTLDRFPPEQFIGRALVIDCRSLHEGEPITMDFLTRCGDKVEAADFLLFCLGWDKRWGDASYFGDYPCLDEAVMDYILKGRYKGIGFDVIGLDPIADVNLTRHKKLFREKDIVNIENLCHLEQCGSDLFWFSCFPLKLDDCDGSPIRAVAWFE